jgi:U2 small nuclear ribonucleoprotein A'
MRMTPELLAGASQYQNPLGERELGLRDLEIEEIENTGATRDQFDAIDLSSNRISVLAGFARLARLRTLLLSNNPVSTVQTDGNLGESLPFLSTLVMTNNAIRSLRDVWRLRGLKYLTVLSLLGNPVVRDSQYRLFTVHCLPHLRQLDFRKVKKQVRFSPFVCGHFPPADEYSSGSFGRGGGQTS